LDIGIIKGIPKNYYYTESYLELFSDQSLIIITVNNKVMTKRKLHSPKQNDSVFRSYDSIFDNPISQKTTTISLAQLKVLTMLHNRPPGMQRQQITI